MSSIISTIPDLQACIREITLLLMGSIIGFNLKLGCVLDWWEKIITLNLKRRDISIPEAFTWTRPSASFRLLLCPFILISHARTHARVDSDTCVCKRIAECGGNLKLYPTVDEALCARCDEPVLRRKRCKRGPVCSSEQTKLRQSDLFWCPCVCVWIDTGF